MPRESYNVRVLRKKALTSLRVGVSTFNGLDDDGRTTVVLLSLQHAFEMLLKAILESRKDATVFDKQTQRSITLEKAINRCRQLDEVKLSESEAGVIRHLDTMRDAEQHWHLIVDEGMLFHSARSTVTLFDDLLQRAFDDSLSNHIPLRILPISAEPPLALDILVDREFERVADLLKPGRKATAEAQARVRTLLAAEAVADPDAAEVRETDVRRVVRGVRDGKNREQIFPKLTGYTSEITGSGITVEVRLAKEGALPVTYTNNPDADTASIRIVDLEKKFYMGPYDLAKRAGISRNYSLALRRHLGIDNDDDNFSHLFRLGNTNRLRYSDNALQAMKKTLDKIDMERVWQSHRTIPWNKRTKAPPCNQPGCILPKQISKLDRD
ncbi:DUF3644 domain-containing protein [Brevibacterium aurantiacum]|uniref:Uncharacterized protein n=1 Tax=Brevibacterium aurantiacum TaxID=273384 RepID=A0A2A3ZU94_BREAU|nr:hypothetical protein CIK59_05335 [Brevibacterium aurantiacum]